MSDFHLLSILTPCYVSLGFILLFLRKKESLNETPKTILFLFMLNVLVFSTAYGIFQKEKYILFRFFDSSFLTTTVLFHPLFYFYVISLTQAKINLRKEIIHILPAILIFTFSSLFQVFLSPQESLSYFTRHLMGEASGHMLTNLLFWTDRSAKALHVVQAVFYFFLIYKILKENSTLQKDVFSYGASNKLKWLFSFNLIYSLGTLMGVAIIFIPQTILEEQHYLMDTTLIFLTGFTLFIGLKGIDQESIGKVISDFDEKYEGELPSAPQSNQILEKINNYIVKEKAFLNPELKIWDIVLATGVNRTYISQAINQDKNMSFNHYINKLRIEEAIKLLEQHENRTLESIAYDSGFNSISTFKRAFNRFTGSLYSDYRKNLFVEKNSPKKIIGSQ